MQNDLENNFYTLKGYELNDRNNNRKITAAMEDYLEMIYRLLLEKDYVRMNELAEKLHVKPSSASKMVMVLKKQELVDYEKYSYIVLTKEGTKVGKYLLFRHEMLNRLLCFLNHSENELEQVERIEHFINVDTVYNIERFLDQQNQGEIKNEGDN